MNRIEPDGANNRTQFAGDRTRNRNFSGRRMQIVSISVRLCGAVVQRMPLALKSVILSLLLTSCVCAQSLENAAQDLAVQVRSILLDRNMEPTVRVGEFRSTFGPAATLGLRECLRQKLNEQMVLTEGDEVEVRGTVRQNEFLIAVSGFVEIRKTSEKIAIGARGPFAPQAEALTKTLRQKEKFEAGETVSSIVSSREDVVALASPTFESVHDDLPPSERRNALDDEIGYALDAPEVHVSGSTVSAAADGRFGVEFLKRGHQGYTLRPKVTVLDSGHAFVDLRRGDEFAVRIINNANFDVGAKVLLDGLNSFSFSRVASYRDIGMYLIPANFDRPVPPITGWHLDNSNVYRFNVTDLPSGAAAEMRQQFSNQIGVISVLFFPVWKAGERPPAAEIGEAQNASGRGLAIGRGDISQQSYSEEKRLLGKTIIAALSIRYQHPSK